MGAERTTAPVSAAIMLELAAATAQGRERRVRR